MITRVTTQFTGRKRTALVSLVFMYSVCPWPLTQWFKNSVASAYELIGGVATQKYVRIVGIKNELWITRNVNYIININIKKKQSEKATWGTLQSVDCRADNLPSTMTAWLCWLKYERKISREEPRKPYFSKSIFCVNIT